MLKNKRFRKAVIILLIIALIVAIITIRPTSVDSVPSLTNESVELDKVNPGRVTVSLKVPYSGSYVSFQGFWTENEVTENGGEAETAYFSLVSHQVVENEGVKASWQETYWYLEEGDEDNDEPTAAWWLAKNTSSNTQGVHLSAGDVIWTATYEIDEDTPAGDYYLGFRGLNATIYDSENEKTTINNEWDEYIIAKVTVTRAKTEVTPTITTAEATYTYTGSQITPDITVTDADDNTIVLEEETDYTVTYGTNVFAGENNGSITINPVETSDYTFEETTINFNIAKADSALTPEQVATLTALLRVPAGMPLSTIPVATYGGQWVDENTIIQPGGNEYPAYYLQNGDADNYNISLVQVPVYGQSVISMEATVDGGHGEIALETEGVNLATVLEDTEVTFALTPDEEYKVDKVLVDDVPATVTNNKVKVKAGPNDMEIVASFKPQREDLTIDGIESDQKIPYTGEPVVLVGSLSVSENDDNITVSDLTTTWYKGADEIEQPTTVGTYQVVYSYYGDNYKGNLVVTFDIIKANSVLPAGVLEQLASRLKTEAGKTLSTIPLSTYAAMMGAYADWVDGTIEVQKGLNDVQAVYITNGDSDNYNELIVEHVPVYGLSRVNITTQVTGGHGTISDSLENVLEGQEQTITLTPEEGYKVDTVKVNGEEVVVSENKVKVTPGPTDVTVVAKFKLSQEDLFISGYEDNQEITYTGEPVVLEGNLVVAENNDNITVDDIETTWYSVTDDGETPLEGRPTVVGTYKAVFSYDGENYKGELEVNFKIVKADSVVPEGVIEQIAARLRFPVGTPLSTLDITPYGATWTIPTSAVLAGANEYPAVYVTNGDVENYNPTNVNIPIYGLSFIKITASVEGGHGEIVLASEDVNLENVLEDAEVKFALTPEDGYQVKSVTVDGERTTVSSNQVTVKAINKDMTVVATFERIPFKYEFLEGAGQTVDLGKQSTATFRIDANRELYGALYVDDLEVTTATITSGSTVVTLPKEFLESLKEGTHTLRVDFTDNGVAATTFTVKAAEAVPTEDKTDTDTKEETKTTEETKTSNTPKTGDKVLVDIYIAIVSGLAVFMIIDHKLNSKPRKSTRRRK